MEIIIGKTAGFCAGVMNAVKKAEKELQHKKNNEKIYCLGEIVHNKQVIEKLEEKGLQTVESIEQAKETGKVLESEKIDLIICSPLKRAKQTAEIINQNRNIPIIYDEDVIERDFGEFEGINKTEILKYVKRENISYRILIIKEKIPYPYPLLFFPGQAKISPWARRKKFMGN